LGNFAIAYAATAAEPSTLNEVTALQRSSPPPLEVYGSLPCLSLLARDTDYRSDKITATILSQIHTHTHTHTRARARAYVYIYMDTRTHIRGSIRFLEKLQGTAVRANNKFPSNISFRVPRALYFLYIDFAELRRSRNFIVFFNGRHPHRFNEIRKP